jgi:hypothetical protein
MWIKKYLDGNIITENKKQGITWLKTPLNNLYEVELQVTGIHGGRVERQLRGYREYWHSRTAVSNESRKPIVVAERIQGLRNDGMWETITWNGRDFIETLEDRPIGKPVIK